jgi:hypothetical protein
MQPHMHACMHDTDIYKDGDIDNRENGVGKECVYVLQFPAPNTSYSSPRSHGIAYKKNLIGNTIMIIIWLYHYYAESFENAAII